MAAKMKTCMIIGSAPIQNNSVFQEFMIDETFVICADGGLDTAMVNNITPNLIIGDFDSAKTVPPENIETIRLPVAKDDTDTMAAIKTAFRRGFEDFVLLGTMGGRFDHTYANLSALQYIVSNGGKAVMAGDDSKIFLIRDSRLILTKMSGCTVSVFPFGCPCCTVSYQGMLYPLTEKCLNANFPLGVSNRIINDNAEITVHSGDALVIVMNAEHTV